MSVCALAYNSIKGINSSKDLVQIKNVQKGIIFLQSTGQSFQILTELSFNPLRPNNDLSQTSHCNIKGVSVSEVMRIENMITPVKFY